MNSAIYNYFRENYGLLDDSSSTLITKYKDMSKSALKSSLKIFTSCLRDSMYAFLQRNGYIEHKIQKGFLPKLSGTLEHTAQLANVINTARTKPKSIVVTLVDLKNALGEVDHNLILEILWYHHIPDQIQQLIISFYSNFQTSVITNSFQTPFITVGRGVLQGDYLSPLTFSLCFNTFIHYISA